MLLFLCLLLPAIGYAQATEPKKTYHLESRPIKQGSRLPIPYEPAISLEYGAQVKTLAHNWLALITSLNEEKDLSVRNIEKMLKINLTQDIQNKQKYTYSQVLDNNWRYRIYAFPFPRKTPEIVVGLYHLGEYPEVLGEYCIDLGYFQRVMKQKGYQHVSNQSVGGGAMQFINKKGNAYLAMSFEGEKHEDKWRDCITSFEVSINNHSNFLKHYE